MDGAYTVSRRAVERIEIVCETCGVIAQLTRPRNAPRPKICDCPTPAAVTPSTRPRLCIHCATKLNRYNPGPACGPCAHARTSRTSPI